ncbi:MAG: RNA polymerase sigma factor [Planctomycetota bacterium]
MDHPDTTQSTRDRTDEQLVEDHRAGDPEAFEALVRRYHDPLLGFLIRSLGDRARAEDVFQDTFLQIHQSLDTFDSTKRFKPWAFTIAANKSRDLLRRERRRPAVSLSAAIGGSGSSGDDHTSFVDLMAADLPEASARLDAGEQSALVQRAIDHLSEIQRESLLLCYFQQLTYQQLADQLGVPVGTVKSRLHGAVAAFARAYRTLLAEQDAEEQAAQARRRIGPV